MEKVTFLLKEIRNIEVFCLSLVIGTFLISSSSYPCTLWFAAGDRVEGGGTLIAKNRDWVPNHLQVLGLSSIHDSGHRYLGLIAQGNKSPGLKAGVNEHGFVVVTASPPSYLGQNKELKRVHGIARRMLAQCKNITEALSHHEWLVGPQFLMLAAPAELALIELGLDGEFRVQTIKSGVLFHSNHYIDPKLMHLNKGKPGVSSVHRHEKIRQFMTSKERFKLDDFIQVSGSTDGGPDNSLWRTGSKPNSTQTLATWIVHQPIGGDALLYLKIANPSNEIKEYRFKLKDIFSGKVNLSEVQ
jgi:hypothetical protein